jgi:tetratricopeptide (TPR) repeat protein
MGQHEEALKDYDRYVVRYGNEAAKEMKEDLLQVFYKRGMIQRQLGQNVNAQRSLDQVVLFARELEEPAYDELLAKSYLDKAHMHLEDEQYEQQIVVLDEMENFFQHRTGEKTDIYLMQALYERAKNYVYRQQFVEALEDLRRVRSFSLDNELAWEVFGRTAKMETTVLRKMGEDTKICGLGEVSRLRLKDSLAEETRKNLMAILRESQEAWVRLGNHEKIVEGAKNIVELFDAETSLDYRKNLTRTRLERMEAAFRLRDRNQVEADFDILRKEIHPKSDILLKELLARATLLYADMMLETGEQKPAIDQYLQMQQIFGSSKGSLVDEYKAKAIFKLGKAYTGIGSRKRAMKAFQELADTFKNRKEEAILINVYKGLLELAALLAEKRFGLWGTRNAKKAHKIYDEMLELSIPVEGEEGDKLLAKAMHNKSKLLLQQKKNKDAEQLVHTLIKTFENSEEPYIRSLVEKAQEDLDVLKLGKK